MSAPPLRASYSPVVARWAESAAVAAACAVFRVTADAPLLSIALLVAALLPALTARRLRLGANAQLLLGALALAGAWWFATVRAEGPPLGTHGLHPVVAGAALFGLLVALPRLYLAAPWGGRRATAAWSLFAIIACGGAVHGAVYPILVAAWAALQLVALNAIDEGRVSWRRLSRRSRRGLLAGGAITGAVVALIALTLPPLHDLAVAKMRGLFGPGRTGFGLHLRLGSLRGMLRSDEVVLRVRGPAPQLLRGVVYDRYVGGRWATTRGGWPKPMKAAAAPELDGAPGAAAGDPSAETGIESIGGERDRYFLPLSLASVAAPTEEEPLQADDFGVVYPPPESEAGRVRLRLGARAVAPIAGPADADLRLPDHLRAPLIAIAVDWGIERVPPRQALDTLARRFQRDFRYSLEFERPIGHDPVIDFLTANRVGHCEYFASGAALLLRAAGVPARVVGGYRVTERNPIGGFHVVREANAHAWVEVWLPPPPAAPNAAPDAASGATDARPGAWHTFDPTPAAPLSAHMAAETPWFPAALEAAAAWFADLADHLPEPTTTEWILFGVLPLLAVFVYSRWRTRRRRRRANDQAAPARYADPLPSLERLLAVLARCGEPRRDDEPLETFAERVRRSPALAPTGPRAAALLTAYAAWRYGGHGDPRVLDADLTRLAAAFEGDGTRT